MEVVPELKPVLGTGLPLGWYGEDMVSGIEKQSVSNRAYNNYVFVLTTGTTAFFRTQTAFFAFDATDLVPGEGGEKHSDHLRRHTNVFVLTTNGDGSSKGTSQ